MSSTFAGTDQAEAAIQVLSGRVTRHDGSPAVGAAVALSAQRLRSAVALGETTTGTGGEYRIEYSYSEPGVDLLVQVTSADGQATAAFRAGTNGRADLTLPDDRTEYAALLDDISPLLDGAAVADLVETGDQRDHTYLARATGQDPTRIGFLATADQLAAASGLPAELFYGLLRKGLPPELSTLAEMPAEKVRTALTAAVDAGIIASADGSTEFAAKVRELGVKAAVNPPDGAGFSPIGEIFAAAIADAGVRERAYTAYLDHVGDLEALWRKLSDDPGATGQVDRLKLALEFGTLTDNDAALVRKLLAKFDAKELTHPRELVKLGDGWHELIEEVPHAVRASLAETDESAGDGTAVRHYAHALSTRVAEAYPTANVAHLLSLSADHSEAPSTRFLADNPEFDLLSTPVNADTVPDTATRHELGDIQRTFKLTGDFDAMQALRDNGFTSAHSIASIGKDAFTSRLAGTIDESEAHAIHARAGHVHAAAANLVTDYRTAGQFDVPWLPGMAAADATAPLPIPDWEELFGSADYGTFAASRSMYGQPAYLVDLLYFLRRLGAGTGENEGVVANALYARRDDLRDIQLSDDNTDLSLPYVDLVNELLESAVAPATAVHPKDRQSSGDPATLRIQPQHVNPGAYEKLRAAVYPWDLPFDLWREQTGSYLGNLGVSRVSLLETFGVAADSPDLLDDERLGLNSVAARIIAGEPLTPPRSLSDYYGMQASTDLVGDLRNVRTLLDAGSLRYTELTRLLDTRFVNPGGTLSITTNPDVPHDTTKMTLSGLDVAALDRLHRFARLQRALGWSATELDRAITGSGGRLDRAALRSITAIRALASRLDLTIDRVLAFYHPVETHLYRTDEQPPLYDRLFLDPAVVAAPNPFALRPDRGELAVTGSLNTPAVTAALSAVLQVSDQDLAELTTGPRSVTPDLVLNLANLSTLVRTVTLAGALSLSIQDLLRLIELSGRGGPFPSLAPAFASETTETELAGGAPMRPEVGAPLPSFAAGTDHELSAGALIRPPVQSAAAPLALSVEAQVSITEAFVDAVDAIQSAGFAVEETDSVLTDVQSTDGAVVPDDSALATTLTVLRTALRSVYQQTAPTVDEKGELTRKNLTLFGWDTQLAQDVVTTLLGTATYTAELATLPETVVFPTSVPVRYNAGEGQLIFTGAMTAAQLTLLRGLLDEPAYQAAVRQLHDAPRLFVKTRMKALHLPVYSAPLSQLPPDFPIPKSVQGKVYFDAGDRMLKSRGYLSKADADAIKAAAGKDSPVSAAVDKLMTNQEEPITGDNLFLTSADADAFFDSGTVTPADRFGRVLATVNPLLRNALSATTIKQQVGQATGLDPATAEEVLGRWVHAASTSPVLQDFLAAGFVGSDPAVPVNRGTFGQLFTSLAFIHRIAHVLRKLRVTAAEIPFLFGRAKDGGWLDLDTLPHTPVTGASALFTPFVRLLELVRLRDTIPGGATTLDTTFGAALAPGATITRTVATLAVGTGWQVSDLTKLAALRGLAQPAQFADVAALRALATAVKTAGKLGVTADRVVPWLTARLTADAAQAAWQTVKAKHTPEDWSVAAAPMQDAIRQRQRGALVSYLLANPLRADDTARTPHWHDTNGLHDYFLLDVEMGATQQTTRLAQAIYSVQLFIQRCLLNLEPPVITAGNAMWKEWEWMQQYQLWMANQKVFLYPENYFEPDLRPDKSPLFADFETEVMQKEITDDSVLAASHHYVEKLNTIARLHPCGTFFHKSANTIYIFARTESTPRTYYMRQWVAKTYWTPWKKIDLDIGSETLVPVVWKDQLFLFWPTFTPAAGTPGDIQHLPDGSPDHKLPAPAPYWNIHLNWSKLTAEGWEAKKITEGSISTRKFHDKLNYFDQHSTGNYFFHVSPDAGDELVVKVVYNDSRTDLDGADCAVNGKFTFSPTGRIVVSQLTARADIGQYEEFVYGPLWSESVNNEFSLWDNKLALLEHWSPNPRTIEIFSNIPSRPGRVLYPFDPSTDILNFFMLYSDGIRSYAIEIIPRHPSTIADTVRVHNTYHAHTEYLLSTLRTALTVDALYSRDVQGISNRASGKYLIEQPAQYNITQPARFKVLPDEDIDFSAAGGYSQYNWELFFHAPLMLAERLTTNQKFADAQKWFHRIFDPTDRSGLPAPQRFWRTKPFQLTPADPARPGSYYQQRIEEILKRLAAGDRDEAAKVQAWLNNPFQPDAVARLRTTAYQKAVVMKYLDNLIAWGDQLFRTGTGESVNKAAQLYILAAELLGRRPEEIFDPTSTTPQSFRGLTGTSVTAAVVAAEHLVPAGEPLPHGDVSASITVGAGMAWLNYFRVPRNEKLLSYWDIVDDRLGKIRAGLTVDGVAAQLSAFGAEIDPSVLVSAGASGLDLATVLDDISAPVPHYRFAPMLTKAKELANEVKEFGAALLTALEKRDAEALARLRSSHEITTLAAARSVRRLQVAEAQEAIDAANSTLALSEHKLGYYSSRRFMNAWEIAHTVLSGGALVLQGVAAGIRLAGSVTSNIPEVKIGFPTTVGASYGGSNLSNSLQNLAGSLGEIATIANGAGSLAATIGGYRRRQDEWDFQRDQSRIEIRQARRQIAAAGVRKQIAEAELANHDLTITTAKEADRFLYRKYTNQELYDWMAGRLATSFFHAYQLAYDVAKRAERAYRHELGIEESRFITFGYWDTLHKGLLSGERLAADLNRMDAAFLDANAREFELAKRISLAQLDPRALATLKETGSCYVSLPEALFDLDTPGHYFRRIKSVSITVPCVAGPYTGVNMTATLSGSSVRVDPRLSDGKYARVPHDTRFRDYTGPIESIVTSTGQDDTGLFDPNLRDERFLPFEGAGAVSQWRLSLPTGFRQFDYESISDVVLTMRYTAREGGKPLADAAVGELRDALNTWVHGGGGKGQSRVFSARREFADQWNRFIGTPKGGVATATFTLSKARFPHLFRDHRFDVSKPEVVLVLSHDLQPGSWESYVEAYPDGVLHTTLTTPQGAPTADLKADPTLAGMPHARYSTDPVEITDTGKNWVLSAPITDLAPALLTPDGRLNPDAVLDVLLICPFTLTPKERH
ncbi:neuraminidase-like domain-containing protein [Amycolatopsis sp. NPDC049868]|uniref:Tc toxin subunit A-related protein n=1 Tax=Amycolatopsis sp. NPDC049868 TaxID=3363934 RepID=UPI0037996362